MAIPRTPVGTINRNSGGVGALGSMTWQELLWWRILFGKLGLWCDGVGRDLTIGVTIIILEPTKDTQLITTAGMQQEWLIISKYTFNLPREIFVLLGHGPSEISVIYWITQIVLTFHKIFFCKH